MATTAGHYGIQTPRSDAQTLNSIDVDELSFGSKEPSFVSPTKLKQTRPATGHENFLSRLTKPTGSTPLAEIKNNARPIRMGGKNEFTPLLKSVTKSEFMKRSLLAQTPSKTKHALGKSASTSDLPGMAEMSSEEYSVVGSEGSPNEKDFAELSRASVSFQKLRTRSPGSSDGAALMTLREQEKVIDDMKKENFSLKLKIFFMQDQLGKLAPEHIQAVLKENVEYKVEQATLRNELKKYKRALVDAERNVARMAEEVKATKNSTDPSFVCQLDHGMSEEEAAALKQAQEEAEENKNEAMFARKEIEDLKLELWETQREKQKLEDEGPEDVAHLEAQIEELKGTNEDLDLEVKTLREEVEQKNDEIDLMQDRLKEKEKALGSRGVGELDEDELVQQLEKSEEEVKTLNQKITDIDAQLQLTRNEFRVEKDQLQGLAAEHKLACEKVEQDLQNLQEAYDVLEKELGEKDEELASYEKEPKGTAGLVEIHKLKLEIADLQGEIQQHELEKGDLEEQIERLQRDAAQLIDKNGQVAKERNEERKTLQIEIEELQIQLRETINEKERAVSQHQRDSELLEERLKDAENQKISLKKQIENFMSEEHTAHDENSRMKQALRDESERHQLEVESLEKQITQLTADIKERRRLTDELESEVSALNEELRSAKRVEDALNNDMQALRERVFSGGRDSEYLKKIQSENTELKQQISSLHSKLDTLSAQRDRLTREMNNLQDQVGDTGAGTRRFEGMENELGSVRAEQDEKFEVIARERDSLQSLLDDTKRQVEIQATRLHTMERNLQDARDDLERERARAQDLLSLHSSSPHASRVLKLNNDVRKLEDLLQQSRLRQAELGKINATQLDEINTLNRRVKRLEGELDAIQGTHVGTTSVGKGDRGLHSQLTLAKGQLADIRAQLAQQEREFQQRLDEQLAEHNAEKASSDDEKAELRAEMDRLKKRQLEAVHTKLKLEEQVRELTRQVARLESEQKHHSPADEIGDKSLLSRLNSVKNELELVREDAEQKENKSQKHVRRLQIEIDNLRDQAEALGQDLQRSKKESDRYNNQTQLLRRQLQESRDTLKRLRNKTLDEHVPSTSTTQVEKRHSAELRGLGKQIRYLKAKLFREETFRLDLQYAKKFFLMQVNCFETFNKVNLQLLQQMGIYPDPTIRAKRPRMRSVALFFIAIARMRRLKNDWAEHRKVGRELKEGLKRLKGKRSLIV